MNDVWAFLEAVNPKIALLVGFFAITGVLDKFTKLKIWSWLLGWIGSKTNAGIDKRLEKVEVAVGDLRYDVEVNRYKCVKEQILDFGGALLNGKEHSKEQFAHVLEVIDEYNGKFADKHNGEIKQTIMFITDEYKRFLSNEKLKNKKEKEKD